MTSFFNSDITLENTDKNYNKSPAFKCNALTHSMQLPCEVIIIVIDSVIVPLFLDLLLFKLYVSISSSEVYK